MITFVLFFRLRLPISKPTASPGKEENKNRIKRHFSNEPSLRRGLPLFPLPSNFLSFSPPRHKAAATEIIILFLWSGPSML